MPCCYLFSLELDFAKVEQTYFEVKVVIEMEATTRNREIINKYKQLVVTTYKTAPRI